MPEQINADKLRRILRAAHNQDEAYRGTSDRFLALGDDIARLESALERDIRGARLHDPERKRRENSIEALREEKRQIAEYRESLSESGYRKSLSALVDYARKQGYVVNEQACTVRPRYENEPGRIYNA